MLNLIPHSDLLRQHWHFNKVLRYSYAYWRLRCTGLRTTLSTGAMKNVSWTKYNVVAMWLGGAGGQWREAGGISGAFDPKGGVYAKAQKYEPAWQLENTVRSSRFQHWNGNFINKVLLIISGPSRLSITPKNHLRSCLRCLFWHVLHAYQAASELQL